MLMMDTLMEPAIANYMAYGKPDTLHSEFHLSYAMPVTADRCLLSV